MKKIKELLPIILIAVVPTFLIWLIFFLRLPNFLGVPLAQGGMGTIVANYDGPLYIVVAKSFYNQDYISANYSLALPTEYFAAHFPLYPFLVRIFAPFAGFPYAMLAVTLLSSVLALSYFYKFIQDFVEKKEAIWITLVFALLPARWLVSRSVGSADPLFVAAILASVYHFRKSQYWLAGIWGALAQLTKSPAAILFLAYAVVASLPYLEKLVKSGGLKIKLPLPILLIPAALLGVFGLYYLTFGDFLAYFKSGDNIHLFFPPFQIFNYSQPWVGTFWLEEVVLVYLIATLGLMKLIKRKEAVLYWFVGIFLVSIFFVSHRDIIRYSLPIVPFLFAAFAETMVKKEFRYVLAILIVPVFLFSLAFISQNVMPISDWAPFL